MACIRKRRGRYVVDHYDAAGIRRTPSFRTKEAAEARLAEVLVECRQKALPVVDPNITVADYAGHWLTTLRATDLKPRTIESYDDTLQRHVVPRLGSARVRDLRKPRVKALLLEKATHEDPETHW